MLATPTCYISPKLEGRPSAKNGRGVFASAPVQAGEVVVVWGGEVITYAQLQQLPLSMHRVIIQVEEELYLLSANEGPGDWVNHSCAPNTGLSGQIALIAMRPIAPGEEICYDYAMSEGSVYDDFVCCCGASDCRKTITGGDWQQPLLQQRYANYFSPYLQRRMHAMADQNRRGN